MNNKNSIVRGAIEKYNPNGARIDIVVDDLDYPSGLAFDSEGYVHFGNVTYHPIAFDIYKLGADGVALESTVYTEDGGTAIRSTTERLIIAFIFAANRRVLGAIRV